jgi:type IV pilus assembly protein PilC
MPYRYLAYTADGQETRGTLDVDSEQAAERILWERQLTIANLERARTRMNLASVFPTVLGPRPQDVVLFTRQLATLTESGVALPSALRLLAGQVTNKEFGRVIGEIEEDIHQGTSLNEGMAKHPLVFPPLYCRMISVGERSGNLGMVLRQLATYIEKSQATLSKVRGAMAYPAFVLALAVVVVLILINFTMPPMIGLFQEFGAELPLPTRILLALTEFTSKYGMFVFAGFVALVLLAFVSVRQPAGRRLLDRIMLRLPLIGRVNIQGMVARLARTMSALLQAGLPLPEVIGMTEETLGNVIVREALENVRQETLLGHGLSDPIAQAGYFPKMLSFMVRVGEETGTLDSHLATVADFYDEEVDRALKQMTAMLEPAMTIVVGVIVGFVAISVILPMYDLLGAIK